MKRQTAIICAYANGDAERRRDWFGVFFVQAIEAHLIADKPKIS